MYSQLEFDFNFNGDDVERVHDLNTCSGDGEWLPIDTGQYCPFGLCAVDSMEGHAPFLMPVLLGKEGSYAEV